MKVWDQTVIVMGAALLLMAPGEGDVRSGVAAFEDGNFKAAVEMWGPLALNGDADAQFNLGQAYRLGKGVNQDLAASALWFSRAAAQGHVEADTVLGIVLFQLGQRTQAIPFLERGVERGDARSQYVLGTMLYNGDSVKRDWPRAYALLTRAAQGGLPAARQSLDSIRPTLTSVQLQAGERLLRPAPPPPKPTPRARLAAKPPSPVQAAAGSAARSSSPARKVPDTGAGWQVQFGAFGTRAAAQAQWQSLSARIPALKGIAPLYQPAGKVVRLRVGPIAGKDAAKALCARAMDAGAACFPVAP